MLQRVMSIFCRIFFVSQCQKISEGIPFLLCLRYIPVAKKFLYKGGGKEYHDFPSKMFCLTPEIFHRGTFSVSLISAIGEIYA